MGEKSREVMEKRFDKKDVVRHKLVQDIVNAYQKYEEDNNNGRS